MVKNKQIHGSLDTNILVRIILGDVPKQIKHIEKILSGDKRYAVSNHAIFELIFVLEKYYGIKRDIVNENIQNIIENEVFITNKTYLTKVMSTYLEHSKLSIIDCALAIQAKEQDTLPFYTFDKALAKAFPDITKIPM